jgi:hypothetical protein
VLGQTLARETLFVEALEPALAVDPAAVVGLAAADVLLVLDLELLPQAVAKMPTAMATAAMV